MTRIAEQQPVGDPVPGWTARPAPAPVTLRGRYVRVEPAGPEHATALYDALCGPDDAPRWTYRNDEMPADVDDLRARLVAAAAAHEVVTFALVPHTEGSAHGLASLMRADPTHGSVEVGAIIYGERLQRTPAATEAMALLAGHVFEELGYRRYEWKCDSLNEPSRRAARRLGFSDEGRFRQAMVTKGRNRDTDWFSIIDAEWPRVSQALERWLDPSNFDEQGLQRSSLTVLTAAPRPTH